MALACGLFLVLLKVEVNQISGSECSIIGFGAILPSAYYFKNTSVRRCYEIKTCLNFSYATPILFNQTSNSMKRAKLQDCGFFAECNTVASEISSLRKIILDCT